MTFSESLLNELKAAYSLPSDYKASQLLEISQSALGHIRKGRGQFSDENLIKIAHLLDADPIETLAKAHIEGANSREMRMIWTAILENANLAAIRASRGFQADQVGEKVA